MASHIHIHHIRRLNSLFSPFQSCRFFATVLLATLLMRPEHAAGEHIQKSESDASTQQSAPVYIIPVEGMIEDALVYMIRRGLREAESSGARAIVFSMNTDGGKLDSADEIVGMLLKLKTPTYTYVRHRAFSAGAMIALATDKIYMAPGSVIGAAMPIMMSPFGGVAEMPESVQEKVVSATAALVRTAAQQKGHDPELAEAMVRPGTDFMKSDKPAENEKRLLTLTNKEAEHPGGDNGKPLLSAGTADTLEDMLRMAGMAGSPCLELKVSSAEKVARFISMISFLLLGAGLLAIYIEIKTPGFGLPGIIGIACLAVFFWGHHVAGLAGFEDMLIFLFGLALLIVEILFIPGFGLVGVSGLALMLLAVVRAMLPQLPTWQASGLDWPPLLAALRQLSMGCILAFGGALLAARLLPKTTPFKGLVLQADVARNAGYKASPQPEVAIGDVGVALTPLRPFGSALFGEKKLDISTQNEMLPVGAKVRVIEIQGGKIVVAAQPQDSNS